jgi:hypothetical protein
MGTVQHFCDRAMLIHDGDMRFLGDPEEAALEYFRLNFGSSVSSEGSSELEVRLVDTWLTDGDGERVANVQEREPITLHFVVEARQEVRSPLFAFSVLNVDKVPILGFGETLAEESNGVDRLLADERLHLTATVENLLVPGRYTITATVARNGTAGDTILHDVQLLDFLVRGTERNPGMVSVTESMMAVVE